MKKLRLALLVLPVMVLGVGGMRPVAGQETSARIGIVVDGPWTGNFDLRALTMAEVAALTAGEIDVRFPDSAYLVGDWTLDGARTRLEQLLHDPEVDVIIAWGVLASHASCCYAGLPKPVVAPVILDTELQDLPLADHGGSGQVNLNYVALPDMLRLELEAFRRIVPFRRLAVLGNEAIFDAIPELPLRSQQALAGAGFDIDLVPVGHSVAETMSRLDPAVDAVHVWPLFHLREGGLEELVRALNDRKLPTFSALGGADLEAGMMATLTAEDFLPRLARRVALNVQRILLGEEPGTIPVAFSAQERLQINMTTARAIGVSPRWEALVEAEIIGGEDPQAHETLSLGQTVQAAVQANLDLEIERRAVAGAAEDVRIARADRRPGLEASISGVVIDDDRAEASFGAQAERSATASLTLSQLLYSDGVSANVFAQKRRQAGREAGLEAVRLDIAFDAAVAYFNLLRAKTLANVRRNNVRLTRQNLELARVRRSIGAANPAEVYRWESQIAVDRQDLIDARASETVAAIAVNQLLHRDLEMPFATVEVDLDDPGLITGHQRFRGFIETPRQFEVLRNFTAEEGLAAAPELRQLDEGIAAQARATLAARRAFYLPTVSSQLSLDRLLADGGAGADLPPTPGAPSADDTTWTLALSAGLALFDGGRRDAELARAEEELARLRLQRDAVAEQIELRIRAAAINARASFSGIDLARAAAVASKSNFDLVADAYARGAVGVLDLLDAQNSAVGADLSAANAVYDFFIDLMEVQRAANQFDFFTNPDVRDAWFERLEAYFVAAGVEPWRDPPPVDGSTEGPGVGGVER